MKKSCMYAGCKSKAVYRCPVCSEKMCSECAEKHHLHLPETG